MNMVRRQIPVILFLILLACIVFFLGYCYGLSAHPAEMTLIQTAPMPAGFSSQEVATEGKVNLNTATAEDLESLPGIGPSLATRIITYRALHNGFQTIEEIKQIDGIGETRFEALKSLITVEDAYESSGR